MDLTGCQRVEKGSSPTAFTDKEGFFILPLVVKEIRRASVQAGKLGNKINPTLLTAGHRPNGFKVVHRLLIVFQGLGVTPLVLIEQADVIQGDAGHRLITDLF